MDERVQQRAKSTLFKARELQNAVTISKFHTFHATVEFGNQTRLSLIQMSSMINFRPPGLQVDVLNSLPRIQAPSCHTISLVGSYWAIKFTAIAFVKMMVNPFSSRICDFHWNQTFPNLGFCSVQYSETPITSPDPFQLDMMKLVVTVTPKFSTLFWPYICQVKLWNYAPSYVIYSSKWIVLVFKFDFWGTALELLQTANCHSIELRCWKKHFVVRKRGGVVIAASLFERFRAQTTWNIDIYLYSDGAR